MSISALAISLVLLLANGFFVAVEFANVAARRSKLEAMAATGDRRAKSAVAAMRNISFQLAGAQLGITVASLLLGAVAEEPLAHVLRNVTDPIFESTEWAEGLSVVIALLVVVFFHMVIGEMVPKNVALAFPESTAKQLAMPMSLFTRVFRPIVWALNSLANLLTRLLGVTPRDEVAGAQNSTDIKRMLSASHEEGLIDDSEHRLLSGMLQLPDLTVESIMTPADKVVAVALTMTTDEVEAVAASTHYSRLMVYGQSRDHVIGFLFVKDLLITGEDGAAEATWQQRVRPALVSSPTTSVDQLMRSLLRAETHFSVIMDDDRKLKGVVTLEDVLETVVGEIIDEYGH